MRYLKTRFRKLWYIGVGAALGLVPVLTAFAEGGGSESS